MISFDLGHVLDRLDGYIGKNGTKALVWLTVGVVVVGLLKLLWDWLTPVIVAVFAAVSGANLNPDLAVVLSVALAVALVQVPIALVSRATRQLRASWLAVERSQQEALNATVPAVNALGDSDRALSKLVDTVHEMVLLERSRIDLLRKRFDEHEDRHRDSADEKRGS